jgi:hypothetical protein
MPVLVWVNRYMPRNQTVSGNLLASKMVPAVRLVCARQPLHCQYERPCRSKRLCSAPSQDGQRKP